MVHSDLSEHARQIGLFHVSRSHRPRPAAGRASDFFDDVQHGVDPFSRRDVVLFELVFL
jgi:hypothetical protein